jgi:glutamate N-acetyltransferase/amino-acid N-acetyltransferase
MTASDTQPAAIEWIEGGGVTTPGGFVAGGTYANIKTYGEDPRMDVGILAATGPCTVAGVFTRNAVVGEPVNWDRRVLAAGRPMRGLVVNSGNANTVTGDQGTRDCARMAELAAEVLGVTADEVLVASTGVIGRQMPMEKMERGIRAVTLSPEGGTLFTRAIMTTDTREKSCAVRIQAGGQRYTVGGCAKGSGMIHPDMGTMFAFITTDAPADRNWLQSTLREVTDRTFNMVDVDMDTSTSDTALLLASGAAGGAPVDASHPAAGALAAAIEVVATRLARAIAGDGEGATALLEVTAEGAASEADARLAARTIASSPLIKTMVTGRDPNWGRVMMAAGRSGARFDQRAASVWIGEHCVLDHGQPTAVDLKLVSAAMAGEEVQLRVHLGAGTASAIAWGCNLTNDYVSINADYTT